jgi:hypothetical protein
VARDALNLLWCRAPTNKRIENMARRSKRRVKQRSAAHRKHVKKARRRRKGAHPKVGYGAKKRRAKKAAKK